jgi:hypothetical protein
MIDPKQISLYTVAHDWWGVAAFGYAMYKVLNYLKSFKENTEAALKAVQGVKADMADGRISIRAELKQQTDQVVGELREMRQMLFTSAHMVQVNPTPRAIRAKRSHVKKTVDTDAVL